MAQHDYNISNNTGALFRADLNALSQAIVTINSGASAPAVTFPGMLWLDLSGGGDGVVRRRNQANTAWLTDIGQDQVARSAAAAAQATADSAVQRGGTDAQRTMTAPLILPGTVPTNNQAVSRAQGDLLYQVALPATAAGHLLVGAAGGWSATLAPALNDTILALSGGLPTWTSTTTVAAPNQVVRTKADGTIDATLIPSVASGLRFRGTFRPAVNAEYPTTGGSGAGGAPAVGDFWVIDGLTTGGYTFLTGTLAGVTVYNGDSIAKSDGANWYRMGSSVDIEGVIKADGSVAMGADFNMGTHNIVQIGGLIARPGTPAPFQGFQLDATNVIVSPQRGTTGPDLAPMATGQIGTDLGRMQIFVGGGGANVALVPVRYFSATAAYASGEYVSNAGFLWRAPAAVSAGAFTTSQWRRVFDENGGTFLASVGVAGGNYFIQYLSGTQPASFYSTTGTANGGEYALHYSDDAGAYWGSVFKAQRNGRTTWFQPLDGTALTLTSSLTVRVQGANAIIAISNSAGNVGRYFIAATDTIWSFNTMNDAGAYAGSPIQIARASNLVTLSALVVAGETKFNQGITLPIGAAFNTVIFNEGASPKFYVTGAAASLNFNLLTDAGAYWDTPIKLVRLPGPGVELRGAVRVWGWQGNDTLGNIFWGSGNASLSWNGSGFTFSHAVVGPSFTPTSDRAVKENIGEFTPRAFDALPFFSFNRMDMGGVYQVGTTAQDVEAHWPEYVTTFTTIDGTTRKGLDIAGLALEIAMNVTARVAALEAAAAAPTRSH